MDVVAIVPYVPSMLRVRPYQFLCGVAQQGHQVTLATLWTSEEERADLDALRSERIEIIAARLSRACRMLSVSAGLHR